MTGNGPPRSGWVMKVVVLPSLVAISICWSIMGVSLCFVILVGGQRPLRLQGKAGMTRRTDITLASNRALEPCPRDRHCLIVERTHHGPRPERFSDDPDQQ